MCDGVVCIHDEDQDSEELGQSQTRHQTNRVQQTILPQKQVGQSLRELKTNEILLAVAQRHR